MSKPLLGPTSLCLFSFEIYDLIVFSGALCNLGASLSFVRKSESLSVAVLFCLYIFTVFKDFEQ